MIDYALILTKKYPQARWRLNGDEYEGLEWLSDDPKPTKKELESHWEEVRAESKRKRDKIESIKQEIRTTKPPQSNPELALRIEKLEQLLGLRDID